MATNSPPLRAVFAGTPQFALPALRALAAHCDVAGVLTQPDRPAGRGRALTASPVKELALSLGLPVAQPDSLKEPGALDTLRALNAEVMVVVAYGLLLPRAVLDLPRLGCLNIHGSLLPRWRGAAPVARAILAGDETTGISIMQMDAGLDTGPVLLEREVPVGNRNAAELAAALAEVGASLLIEALDGVAAGTLHAQPQPVSGASYAAKLSKAESRIDWQHDALAVERQVRALNPWPVAQTSWRGAPLRVWRARLVAAAGVEAAPGTVLGLESGVLRVACGRGVLGLAEVQLAGKRVVNATDFANSQSPDGACFDAAEARAS